MQQLEELLRNFKQIEKDVTSNLDDLKKQMTNISPEKSKVVMFGGAEVVATLTKSGSVILDFKDNKEQCVKYYNNL